MVLRLISLLLLRIDVNKFTTLRIDYYKTEWVGKRGAIAIIEALFASHNGDAGGDGAFNIFAPLYPEGATLRNPSAL